VGRALGVSKSSLNVGFDSFSFSGQSGFRVMFRAKAQRKT